MNEQEWMFDREFLYHLDSAVSWHKLDDSFLSYNEIQICMGMIYAAIALQILSVADGMTILFTLRRSDMYVSYLKL